MGGSFFLKGIGHWMYPNSGVDDNQGMLGHWIVSIGAAIFFTMSALSMAHFALMSTRNLHPIRDNLCCARNSPNHRRSCFPSKWNVAAAEFILVVALSGLLTGGVWCSVTPDLQIKSIVDDAEPTDDVNMCLAVMEHSGIALHIAYALLWIPVGLMLRSACLQWPLTILGLPTNIAASLAILLQWSVGSMYPVYLWATVMIRGGDDESFLELWQRVYGSVLYHWGMLLTLYCFHNISNGLPEGCHPGDDEGPPAWSMEWFLCQIGFGPENDPENRVDETKNKNSSSRSVTTEKSKKGESCSNDGSSGIISEKTVPASANTAAPDESNKEMNTKSIPSMQSMDSEDSEIDEEMAM
jgi:hypothetical protein